MWYRCQIAARGRKPITRWDQKENVISESSARHKRGIRTQLSNVKERSIVDMDEYNAAATLEDVTVVIPGGGGQDKRRLRTSRL